MSNDKIVIRGAREHNLKNVSLTIPRDKLVVMGFVYVAFYGFWCVRKGV